MRDINVYMPGFMKFSFESSTTCDWHVLALVMVLCNLTITFCVASRDVLLLRIPLCNLTAVIILDYWLFLFSWRKRYTFRLKFHWNLFLRVQLTISEHWFRYRRQATILIDSCLVYRRTYASLGLNEWNLDVTVGRHMALNANDTTHSEKLNQISKYVCENFYPMNSK